MNTPAVSCEEICKLIESGAEAWIRAGQIITALRSSTPDLYKNIIAIRPWMTASLLHTLERIGRKEVYPYVLLEPSGFARSLLGYSYNEQERACQEGVEVLLYYKNGKPFHQKIAIRELSRQQSKQVFGPTRLRKPEEQLPFLASDAPRGTNIDHGRVGKQHALVIPAAPAKSLPGRRESLGVFKCIMHNGVVTMERLNSEPPPGITVVNLANHNGKKVAYVQFVETVVGVEGELTEREKRYREFRNTVPFPENS